MPFCLDRPSLEVSPADHDAEAVVPGSTAMDVAAIGQARRRHGGPDGPILVLGCGTGRHVEALHATGEEAWGLDLDPRMLAAAAQRHPAIADRLIHADASTFVLERRFATITLLNRSLVCFHSHRLAWGLFTSVAAHLLPGGLFLIDNCCTALWDQVKQGLLADGLSEDGRQQLIFLPGENRFTWRRDDAVRPDHWTIDEDDRIYRLWSLAEVALAAAGAGLRCRNLDADSRLLVLQGTDEGENPCM